LRHGVSPSSDRRAQPGDRTDAELLDGWRRAGAAQRCRGRDTDDADASPTGADADRRAASAAANAGTHRAWRGRARLGVKLSGRSGGPQPSDGRQFLGARVPVEQRLDVGNGAAGHFLVYGADDAPLDLLVEVLLEHAQRLGRSDNGERFKIAPEDAFLQLVSGVLDPAIFLKLVEVGFFVGR